MSVRVCVRAVYPCALKHARNERSELGEVGCIKFMDPRFP